MKINPLLEPHADITEIEAEASLRPESLSEFIGQSTNKKALSLALRAAGRRGEPIDHTLLYGPPGLGKTTLAYIIAKEQNSRLHITSGPAIERAGDLAALLTNLKPKDVLFIDEIHRINKSVEETLYAALEDFKLDIILGKGPAARSIRLKLKPFTLVGATTKFGLLTSPLRSRFGLIQKLSFYSKSDIKNILLRSAKVMKVTLDDSSITLLAERSRGTPRIANRLLRRTRDMAELENNGRIDGGIVERTCKLLGVDSLGLDKGDRQVLRTIIKHHSGGPVGIQTIASSLSEDERTIEEVYEPFLIQAGLLARTKSGRVATDLAYAHLGLSKS